VGRFGRLVHVICAKQQDRHSPFESVRIHLDQ